MAEHGEPETICRTAAQEVEDRDTAIKNILNESYLNWPNECGFDNLDEHRGPLELAVKGVIPSWAAGSLFRNGPGARKIDNTKSTQGKGNNGTVLISHWFDGLAHLHRFDIVPSGTSGDQVKVFYSSRRQTDDFVRSVQKNGNFGGAISFGQKADPCVGIFGKAMSSFRALSHGNKAAKYDNLNVAVFPALHVPALEAKGPSKSPSSPPTSSNSGNGSAGNAGKKLWITSDMPSFRVIDATTLEPHNGSGAKQQSAFNSALKGPMSCAHVQRCPKTGDAFNCNIEPGPVTTYRIFRVSAATGKTDVLASISRLNLPPAYIHSFFLSERFVVLRVPTTHFGKMGLSIPWKGNLIEAIEPFDESKKCRWFFIDRVHGQGVVAELETPAGFFFHSVNAWDELVAQGGKDDKNEAQFVDVYCDVVDFPNTDVIHKFYYDVLLNINGSTKTAFADKTMIGKTMSSLVRWKFRVPLPTSSATTSLTKSAGNKTKPEKVFSIPNPHCGELPTINPDYHTRQHRYVYGLPQTGQGLPFSTIVKTDTVTREVWQWNNPAGHTPGEAIFVPRPGSMEEEDGVLLSVVLDGHSEMSYLVCIDAKTMQETGRADMNFAVAFDLHGVHSPN